MDQVFNQVFPECAKCHWLKKMLENMAKEIKRNGGQFDPSQRNLLTCNPEEDPEYEKSGNRYLPRRMLAAILHICVGDVCQSFEPTAVEAPRCPHDNQ